MRRPLLLAGGGILALLVGLLWWPPPVTVEGDLAGAVEAARPGSELRLPPGRYQAPVTIDKPLSLVAEPGAVLVAASDEEVALVIEATEDVTVRGLAVEGAKTAVLVRQAEGVVLEGLTVTGAALHGVLTQDAEVAVTGCRLSGFTHSLAQGVELTNSNGRPASLVRGCVIRGPVYEGIASHVSTVRFLDNEVIGSTERGIVIHEMSMGRMQGNRVLDSSGAAYYCGDMSICTVIGNAAEGIASSDDSWRSSAGHGLVVHFHSEAYVEGLEASRLSGDGVALIVEGVLADRPLDVAEVGTEGVRIILAAAAVLLALPFLLGRRRSWAPLMFAAALGVQIVHQAEHVIQLVQAHLLGLRPANGLAGAALDNEWVHLGFNGVLTVALFAILVGYGRSGVRRWLRTNAPAAAVFLGGVGLQSYHQVEHVVKGFQHALLGATPAPGILGGTFDLVWLHFLINLAVTAAVAVGFFGLWVPSDLEGRLLPRVVPEPA